jgi:hypothetical protein
VERGKTPCFVCLFVPFFFFFSPSLFSISPHLSLFGPHPTLRCHECSLQGPITAARAFLGGVAPYVRHGGFFFFCPTVALRARRTAYKLIDSGSGEGAEVTLVRHMTHGVSGLGRTKHIPFPWPYSFIRLDNFRSNHFRNLATRCCCLFPYTKERTRNVFFSSKKSHYIRQLCIDHLVRFCNFEIGPI